MAVIAIIMAFIGLLLLFSSLGLSVYWLMLQLRKMNRDEENNPIPIGEN